ncbi:unnamed protein product [Lathyrus sativus]|nr:unnamed protein product [Lathyrus sativus]
MEHMTNVGDGVNDENVLFGMMENGGGGGSGGGGGNDDVSLKKGPWTTGEDAILIDYVTKHGEGNWNAVQRNTGLNRCGKSCRLRWANHLRPNLKKGAFSHDEEKLIVELHAQFGNKWARMAALLPGRTDNEIKNYWNTRIKRRQRQGLPLYSDEQDRPNTPTTPSPCTPTGSNLNNNMTPKFEFFNQYHPQQHHLQQQQHLHPLSPTPTHHHSPLSSPLQHRQQQHQQHSYSPHTFLDTSSSSSFSPLSFTFQRPAPLLSTPLRFKRYRSTPSFSIIPNSMTQNCSSSLNDPSLTSHHQHDSFRFPMQYNSSFPQYFHTHLLESDLAVSSNQYLRTNLEQDVKPNIDFNDPNSFQNNNSIMMGDILMEAQTLASGQNSKKRNYLSLNEGNDMFNGCQSIDDFTLSSIYWPSNSGTKSKEEAPDLSKFMNDEMSTMLTVMPSSTMQSQDWNNNNNNDNKNNNNNNNALEVTNVQSSSGVMGDENFGLDIKPIASLFPLTNTTNNDNSNENNGCYSWDNLSGLC